MEMKVGSRFIVSKHYHDERYANQTGMIVKFADDGFRVDEVSFDNLMLQMTYKEEDVQFDTTELMPSHQKGNRDREFEDKLKEAIISLFERGELKVSTNLSSDYDGKLIETKVVIDGEEVYSKEERVSITF